MANSASRLQNIHCFYLAYEKNQFSSGFGIKLLKQNKTIFPSYPIQTRRRFRCWGSFPDNEAIKTISFLQQCRQELVVRQSSCGHETIMGMKLRMVEQKGKRSAGHWGYYGAADPALVCLSYESYVITQKEINIWPRYSKQNLIHAVDHKSYLIKPSNAKVLYHKF